jgi:UDP-glucose 4-epimerase
VRIAVTGCRGFVGGSIARVAARAGHVVLGLGRSAEPELDWPGQYHQADVASADLAGVLRAFKPDVVFHAAGSASVGASLVAPLDDLRASVHTWANTLDAVRRSGVHALVIFPSSAAVYGNPTSLPVAEDAALVPISPYGFHKAACEMLAREYVGCYGLDIVVGRIFSTYGPRQHRLLLWDLFVEATGPAPEITLQGTGDESRDYLHVEDVSAVFLELAARHPAGLTIVNVGSGVSTRVGDLARLVADAVGSTKPVRALGVARRGDPAHWQASIERLFSLVDIRPRPLADGVRECVAAWSALLRRH